jgi:hypothetical protein
LDWVRYARGEEVMLRYILRTSFRDGCNGCEGTKLFTIDGDATLVEDALQSGGRSEDSFERTELVGVEVIK